MFLGFAEWSVVVHCAMGSICLSVYCNKDSHDLKIYIYQSDHDGSYITTLTNLQTCNISTIQYIPAVVV